MEQTSLKNENYNPEYTFRHCHSFVGNEVYFQEEVGTIIGNEVTDGFFTNLMEEKQVIESACPPVIGKDAIIVEVKNS